jgi:hypothetical protein
MQLDSKARPAISELKLRAKALAMLDAIIAPDWEDRYYSYNQKWCVGEEMASMRNGSGDDWFILFGEFGAAIKGLDHESKIAGNSILSKEVERQLPKSFSTFYKEPAFGMDWLSFCYWCESTQSSWEKVIHPDTTYSEMADGSLEFLSLLYEPASSYQEFASWYYEREISLEFIEKIYSHHTITEQIVHALNPELSIALAKEFAAEIGYPT